MPSSDPDIAFAVADIGGRAEMEDEHVLEVESTSPLRVLGGVFDGHGGSAVARLARDRFPILFRAHLGEGPERAFLAAYAGIQREAEGLAGGAVAATFYLDVPKVVVANAGDAHIVAVSRGRAVQLTEDHRLSNPAERRRVVEAGAEIYGPYVCLPDGNGIMPTRTLGDHAFARVGVLSEPAVSTHVLSQGFLVTACDGLWDVLAPKEVPPILAPFRSARDAAMQLAHVALRVRRTPDNLTVLVVRIP